MYTVQIGKGKGSYSNRWPSFDSLADATFWYIGLNVGNGYKKRLLGPGGMVINRELT